MSGTLTENLVQAAYIVAAVLFVLSLAGLSKHESAKEGNAFGVTGMALALVATVWLSVSRASNGPLTLLLIAVAMAVGASVGLWRARVVEMTQMPELVAMLHSFVGLAAVLVGYSSYLETPDGAGAVGNIHSVEVFLGVFIGAVTFTGSIVAFLKLSARIKSSPLMLPARHWLNLAALVVSAVLLVWFVQSHSLVPLAIMTVVALAFGWHLVASIGGGDMPVVVSMLNSYSGWAAAAAGFMLGNDLLIVTGALVGSSGAILSYIMCKAMNRSFVSVIAGGFGQEVSVGEDKDYGEHRETIAADVAELLKDASSVVITPGYGMAVAQAQYP
ncbi:MAG: NAD(P)(+) transhydrogenase (Re/Si-specific) subunit beta, partial [Actinomycetales bacterium]